MAMMYAHMHEPPPSVTEARPDLPPEVDAVIAQAMAKSKDDRYERPTEFALALKQAVGVGAASGVSAVVAQPGAGGTVLAGASVVGRAQAEEQAEPPAQSPPKLVAGPVAAASRVVAGPASAGRDGLRWRLRLEASDRRRNPRCRARGCPDPAPGGAGVLRRKSSSAEETTPTTTAAQSGGTTGGATPATLLSVLAPSQVAKECTPQNTRAPDALETNLCVSAPTDPTSQPDQFQFSFYRSFSGSAARLRASSQASAWHERRGRGCVPAPPGERPWLHPTGKRGGRFFCYQDKKGNFVIVWTHEKLGSDDHVDMLGSATEPGRAPTIVGGWWNSLNDSIGKCRPTISQELCLNTISRITGSP